MGFSIDTKRVLSFIYKVQFSNGLTEHEFDHVFIGKYNKDPLINPDEIDDWKWISKEDLRYEINSPCPYRHQD